MFPNLISWIPVINSKVIQIIDLADTNRKIDFLINSYNKEDSNISDSDIDIIQNIVRPVFIMNYTAYNTLYNSSAIRHGFVSTKLLASTNNNKDYTFFFVGVDFTLIRRAADKQLEVKALWRGYEQLINELHMREQNIIAPYASDKESYLSSLHKNFPMQTYQEIINKEIEIVS